MELRDDADLQRTRELLREFQARYQARQLETPADEHVHRLTLMSLKRQINQLIEDIARYESRLHQV